MGKFEFFLFGAAFGAVIMSIFFGCISPTEVKYTYDGRPYVRHGAVNYMLISDQPMKIKNVNVVESEGK